MSDTVKHTLLFVFVGVLILLEGSTTFLNVFSGSWNSALVILNMGLISAIMALGVNLQWGFAGLFNVGIMGFTALGGLAVVLVSTAPTPGAFTAGGMGILMALVMGALTVVGAVAVYRFMAPGIARTLTLLAVLIVGFFVYRALFDPSVEAVEAINPALEGNIGGLGLPVLLAWPAGGLLAAGAAWLIGKTALGLRSDYLAIATLGIAEIIIAVLKNEDWLSRGVKNVVGLPRPVPYEVDLQNDPAFVERAASWGMDAVEGSTIFVKLGYSVLFAVVLLVLLWMAQMALKSPWGRMMRAIRDNEVAAEAMGKDVTRRHLQIFVLGSAICGIAGAMMTTLDSQLTPGTYNPLRFTFLIWVMVIVGGSGNNFGAVLGGMLIWFFWIKVEPMGIELIKLVTAGMADGSWLKDHLMESASHMRLFTMGLILLLVLRFSPRGLIPEK
ncbi:branched-chain amino acid ABC transporter permease [Phaeobacter gallaeciensis]|jgi:branched-chain amino acid transport system permease protein|uniref:Branched-chain amino acid ABC transporter permease n=1 Tax=Phaeobacter gallaeciensis TaxID=60890 RepID=A0A1B0ZLS1_9RHOB|nr:MULTISPECIES: branched-chain amino acid ABC transporter permease [Phaeobacter]MEE2634531.1 branched-chain amino acid ABC transporter permease [Pseudomonadota bacterium]ANP35094.1 branched-chain amino acid ABC transporter permease [Phaeobacter gallaeciensis]MDE4096458.1 branched-chain amino acid ABC transporter permease [Phaeobacter gallaeciensis]MDE4105269.1 branched-chain amino acid ABC transporter permease [Phaeobacter gallaeciensis]MDE4109725.1 branched-chain amino acid ABC transporter p